MLRLFRLLPTSSLFVSLFLSVVVSFPADARRVDLPSVLEDVGQAYFDVFEMLPQDFACVLESEEIVASLPPRVKAAWGEGAVIVKSERGRLRLEASGVEEPEAKGAFDLALAAWQLRIGIELGVAKAYLPAGLAALAVGVAASSLTHSQSEEATEWGRQLVWQARDANHKVQNLVLEVGKELDLRRVRLANADGSELDVRLENDRFGWSQQRWVPTALNVRLKKRNGKVETTKADFRFRPVHGRSDVLILQTLGVTREDGEGRLLRDFANQVNPIRYNFDNCIID